MFIRREMIEALPNVQDVVEVAPSATDRSDGMEEMVFSDLEEPAAAELMGPIAHRPVAAALGPILERFKSEP